MGQDPMNLRASEEDRRQVEEVLSTAFREGRITAGELSERLGALHSSQTYKDLANLVTDLPHGLSFVPSGRSMQLRGQPQMARVAGPASPSHRVTEIGLVVLFGLVAMSLLPAILMTAMRMLFFPGLAVLPMLFVFGLAGVISVRASRRFRRWRR